MKTVKEINMVKMVKFIKATVLLYTFIMVLAPIGKTVPINHSLNSSAVCTVYAAKGGNDGNSGDSSGVAELDAAKTRTNGLVVWFCHWIGGIVFIIALIVFLFMAGTHQTEQRNTALVVLLMGAAVFFAPSIVNYVLGKTIF